ncbi:AAA family ATPase [Methylorubrum extorquens]
MSFDAEIQPGSRGGGHSIVEKFEIIGLHGYKNVSLESKFAATVLIAKNGAGKTTLLAALDAFLKRQFSRLRDVNFKEIRCKLRDFDRELILKKAEVQSYSKFSPTIDIIRLAKETGIETTILTRYIVEGYEYDDTSGYNENETWRLLVRAAGYRRAEAINRINRLRKAYLQNHGNLEIIEDILSKALSGIEILYLPTYRRVELPLIESDPNVPRSRRSRPKLNVADSSLFPNDIQFGLSDISQRLYDLNQTVLSESNIGYRKVSANIISDMLDGTFDNSTYSIQAIPEKEELSLFFSRLKENHRYAGPFTDVVIPNLDRIYSESDISDESSKFLRYYLTKLETVIRTTKDVEKSIEDFITKCNKYLCAKDPSTERLDSSYGLKALPSSDEKTLRLNRTNLSVSVESVVSGRKISLDALSSGEKQMVSLFAKMYLYFSEKIVLIDEPELSLSIDWQRQILVDIINSPLCKQVVAITHSPFVFENELDPYARSLKLEVDWLSAQQDVDNQEGEDELGE